MKKDERSPHAGNQKGAAKKKGAADAGKKSGGDANPIPDIFKPVRAAVQSVRPKNAAWRWLGLIIFAILLTQAFLQLLNLNVSALLKFAGSALLFMAGGELMRGWMGWDGFWGLILFKDRSTLAWIDRQAQRYSAIWQVLSDLGLVMGYGLCSYFLLGPEAKKPKRLLLLYGFGLPLLLVFATFIAPTALTVMTGLVAQNDFHAASNYLRGAANGGGAGTIEIMGTPISAITILLGIALLVGGLAATTFLSLLFYAVIITPPVLAKIGGVIISIITGHIETNNYVPPPGGAPILPGINLPFVEGILALAVLLVVHEMSHGLLARIAKIRLDSAGIVFFGILPFGAFVEPDEKELDSAPAWEQNRVLVAGSAANLMTAILAFAVLVAFMSATAPYRLEGWQVVPGGTVPAGTLVYSINGTPYEAQNLTLAPHSSVVLQTSRGTMERTTDAQGRIGIHLRFASQSAAGFQFQYAPQWEWMGFVANLLGLVFALDVLVGIVNLLPIPLFDGHRLMANGVGNKKAGEIIAIVAALAFVLNFLPWLFK